MAAGMTGTIKARSVPLCLCRSPRAAAAPEALRRTITSNNVNPPNGTPRRLDAYDNYNADVRPEGRARPTEPLRSRSRALCRRATFRRRMSRVYMEKLRPGASPNAPRLSSIRNDTTACANTTTEIWACDRTDAFPSREPSRRSSCAAIAMTKMTRPNGSTAPRFGLHEPERS